MPPAPTALRGDVLRFTGDPFVDEPARCLHATRDALVVMEDGRITHVGPAAEVDPAVLDGVEVVDTSGGLILPGFVDTHVHYAQLPIVGAYGEHLLEWLQAYAFPAERAFADEAFARGVARTFLREALRHGTTTSAVWGTVHPGSVRAFFEESHRLGMRNLAGKVLMDRNAPEDLLDDARRGDDDSRALIEAWHGRGRQLYAITPRFAPTSTADQLRRAGALWREYPGTYVQTHVAESEAEVAWVAELFPEREGYLDVYDHHGLLGPRAILAHGIHLSEDELRRCHGTGTALAHCPTSNLFLGSGLFDLARARAAERPVQVGLGTDVGAGTSLSLLQTLGEAYKVAALRGFPLGAVAGFWLATTGGARALGLSDRIGDVAVGHEADLVVLDRAATPLLAARMENCADLEEELFVLMTLGDDRAVRQTWIAGRLAHDRDAPDPPGDRAP